MLGFLAPIGLNVASRDEAFTVVVFVLLPGLFLAIGVRSLYYYVAYRGLSADQIRARADRALSAVPSGASADPTVPTPRHTRGKLLPYRLTPERDLGFSFLFLVLFALLWSVPVVGVLSVSLKSGAGVGVLVSVAFFIPLLFVLGWIAHRLLAYLGIRPTDIEISEHPLRPGDTFQVAVTQRGRLQLTSLLIDLLCEEKVCYQQGTDSRTETHVVFRYQSEVCRSNQP